MFKYQIQRFRGGFAIVWHDDTGRRHRYKLDATDRLGAEAEARRRLAAGRRPAGTVGQIVQAYIADRRDRGTVSAPRMADAWKALAPVWENIDPANIDEAMCRRWVALRRQSPATMRYELALVGTACNWAVRQKWLTQAPRMWLPAPPPRRERHITRAQFRDFLAAIRAPHARLYAILGIGTAARPAAILDLEWPQVDFAAGLIRLNPPDRVQTAKGRATVPMSARVHEALQQAWPARTTPFVIEHGGHKVASVKTAFRMASQRSGIHVTPYTLRHSAAVWMAESGIPLEEIAAYLGHSDTRTTFRHYAKYGPSYLKKAATALDW